MQKIKTIIFGCGYWGQKIISNLENIPDVEIVGICDNNEIVRQKYQDKYKCFSNYEEINIEFDISFIITRIDSHYGLAKKSLLDNKYVFIEKPITSSIKQAKELIKLAKKQKRLLFADHTFLFASEVEFFKDSFNTFCKTGAIELKRVNNGPFSKDLNVIQDLCPHDYSILNYIVPYELKGISANGVSIINNVIEKANIILSYKNTDFKAFVEVSWLESEKLRYIRMINKNGVSLYHKNNENFISIFDHNKNYISNKTKIKEVQSLFEELKHVVHCLRNNEESIFIDGKFGIQVMKMLSATNKSISKNGKMIYI